MLNKKENENMVTCFICKKEVKLDDSLIGLFFINYKTVQNSRPICINCSKKHPEVEIINLE